MSAQLPETVKLQGHEARTIVECMDGLTRYLTTAWMGIEQLADESNASTRRTKEAGGEAVEGDEVYEETERIRRKSATAVRFALQSIEFVHEMLNARSLGFGKDAHQAEPEADSGVFRSTAAHTRMGAAE